jgi:hypothetical protein
MSNGVEFTEDVLLGQNEMANNRSGATATERQTDGSFRQGTAGHQDSPLKGIH